jgi:hypothetical protein
MYRHVVRDKFCSMIVHVCFKSETIVYITSIQLSVTLQFRLVHLILDKNLKTQSLLQHIILKTLQMFSLKISLKAG